MTPNALAHRQSDQLVVQIGEDPDDASVAIVALRARLGARDGRAAWDRLRPALRAKRLRALIVDLDRLETASGGGLALIVRLGLVASRRGIPFYVTRPRKRLEVLLACLEVPSSFMMVRRDLESVRRDLFACIP